MKLKVAFIWCEIRGRIRYTYNEWKCWFLFHHRMESLGQVAEGKFLYQCSFCFKRIHVLTFGAKGISNRKAAGK